MPKPDEAIFVRDTLSPHYGPRTVLPEPCGNTSGGMLTPQQDACLRNISQAATLIRWAAILLPFLVAAAAGLVWVLRDSPLGELSGR